MTQQTKTAIVCEDGVSAEYEGVRVPLITTTPLKAGSEVRVTQALQKFSNEQWIITTEHEGWLKDNFIRTRRAFEIVQEESLNDKADNYAYSVDNVFQEGDQHIENAFKKGYTQRNYEIVKLVEGEIKIMETLVAKCLNSQSKSTYRYALKLLINIHNTLNNK